MTNVLFELWSIQYFVINMQMIWFQDNQYIEAMKNIGGLLSHYDTDKSFAAFGFGAKVDKKKKKDYFPLSGSSSRLYLNGMQVMRYCQYCVSISWYARYLHFKIVSVMQKYGNC